MAGICSHGGDGAESLPEDVLFEVFSRVRNLKDLFSCAATCRRWLRLFTNPDFLRQLWPEHDRAPPLVGFFSNAHVKTTRRRRDGSSSSVLDFTPIRESPIGIDDCTLASFVPADHNFISFTQHLASRRGLLLTRFREEIDLHERRTRYRFVLCDPITGAHDVLPELGCTCVGLFHNGYAILAAGDFDPSHDHEPRGLVSTRRRRRLSMFSQLLLVGLGNHQSGRRVHVHTYSAATRSWSAPVICMLANLAYLRQADCPAVVHRSSARWLYADDDPLNQSSPRYLHVLCVEINSGCASFTKLPVRFDGQPLLCVSRDNRLLIACVHATRVNVWTQQQEGNPAAWIQTSQVLLKVPSSMPLEPQSTGCQVRSWFYMDKGILLAKYRDYNAIFVVDLDTWAMDKVMDFPHSPPRNYLPYTMDLPELFLSQLAFSRGY